MNRILLVDLGERELKKRQALRAALAEYGGMDPEDGAHARYVLVDFGEADVVQTGTSSDTAA